MSKRRETATQDNSEKGRERSRERRVKEKAIARERERRSHIDKVALEGSGSRNSRCFYSV